LPKARKAPVIADPFTQRWSVWTAGYGGSQTTGGNAALGSNTATSRVFGAAVGADYRVSPFTLAGFALAGGGTNFSVANGGSGRSDLFQVGAFVRHTVGSAYISAALAYGWQDITTDRTVTIAGVDMPNGRCVRRQHFRIELRRQERHGIAHRVRRDQMAERLVGRRHLRGRILRRNAQLRRQGCRALRLVTPGVGPAMDWHSGLPGGSRVRVVGVRQHARSRLARRVTT
jgi:hypothetical protein